MKMTLYFLGSLLFVIANLAQAENATVSPTVSEIENLTETAKKGEPLHNANCVACHSHVVYIRENRRLHNYDSLKIQVERCTETLGIGWWPDDEEMLAVIAYLNEKYYKFKKTSD
ncbi:MAG TPA: cytochrome c [Thiotrichaceae bacterium]|nr:cytochrome c [Thiotrichaceae bacterium]